MSDLGDVLFDGDGDDSPPDPNSTLAKVEKAGVAFLGCAVTGLGLVGASLGAGLGGLYHTFFAPQGALLGQIAIGALLGLLAGVRILVPLEDLVLDFLVNGIANLFSRGKRGDEAGPSED